MATLTDQAASGRLLSRFGFGSSAGDRVRPLGDTVRWLFLDDAAAPADALGLDDESPVDSKNPEIKMGAEKALSQQRRSRRCGGSTGW